jgi:hypothetical protein
MNVIVTAHSKTQYADSGFMQAVGETFDGEKKSYFYFDTIVQLFVTDNNKHMGRCLKDRSNRLPTEPFEISYKILEGYLSKEKLEKPSEPVDYYATEKQISKLAELINELELTQDQVNNSLMNYNAESLDELTVKDADVIIEKLKNRLTAKKKMEELENE